MYERREKDLEILRQDCELAIIASHRRSNQISNTPEKKACKIKGHIGKKNKKSLSENILTKRLDGIDK